MCLGSLYYISRSLRVIPLYTWNVKNIHYEKSDRIPKSSFYKVLYRVANVKIYKKYSESNLIEVVRE